MKKNKINHVRIPTNEEENKYNKKRKLKIIGIITSIIIVVGGIFLYLNKDNLELSGIMGNSSVKTVTFKPNKINSKNINQFYYSDNDSFVWSLYEKAGFARDYLSHGYKKIGIKVYDSKNKHLKTYKEGSIFIVNKSYAGKTLNLSVYMQNIKTKKNTVKQVKLYIDKNSMYNLTLKNMVSYANSLVGLKFTDIKKTFSSYENVDFYGDWCSYFVWNIYHKYGFAKKGTWKNSIGDYDYDPDLRYALGWTTYGGYHGYLRGVLKNKNDLSYKPQPGDLILFKWDDTGNSVDHVGIVKKVSDNYIETIEGNVNGNGDYYYQTSSVAIKKRAISYKKYIGKTYDYNKKNEGKGEILGYFSPKKYF